MTQLFKKDYPSKIIKPHRLKQGDTIALVTPGSFITEEQLQSSVQNLENLGLRVQFSENIIDRNGYLAGVDEKRAQELNNAFSDKNIKGIVCARGGYGCMRILDLLDYKSIKRNPKVFIGFSDITALLFSIFRNTGLVVFHGPMGISEFNGFTSKSFVEMLMEPKMTIKIPIPNSLIEEFLEISKGKVEGELIGGNLSILTSLTGSKYDLDYSGKILFIEEIGELPYRIDRMLTHLLFSGKLKHLSGIILGNFWDCERDSVNKSFTLSDILKDRLSNLEIPVAYGYPFGHIENNCTLPFGVKSNFNTEDKTISLLESPIK